MANIVVTRVIKILDLLYKHGWDERNGGNLSLIISKDEAKSINPNLNAIRSFNYDFDMSDIVDKYFLVTGTGKYFKNCFIEFEHFEVDQMVKEP